VSVQDVTEWVTEAGRCLDCGQRMYAVGGLSARCDCWDEPSVEVPGLTPTFADAAARRPVAVVREGHPTVFGRLLSVGGDRRTSNGRAKVRLPSGAVLSPWVWEVVLVDGDEVAS
jgi:hypothetical protein